ncbi:YqaA family protein [Pararhizobium sp. PWRC1-1]|uniref:YqaA family protein n=1 Tax=Pararhizobium sp. PWRC1-1 TaxID=2804566 RepID=UPI003CFA9F6C
MTALAAATILPAQSEAHLVYLIVDGGYSIATLVENVLGAVMNWMLGRYIERFRSRRWFPVSPQRIDKAQDWYQRYGKWSLLRSWVPIIGDPITMVAGVLREPLATFVILVSIAKVGRYVVLALATTALT